MVCCVTLPCLFDLACFFLPSFSVILWQEFASESEESETDVNIENEYYQAKAAKEDNPQAAIAGFERVRTCTPGGLCACMQWYALCLWPSCIYSSDCIIIWMYIPVHFFWKSDCLGCDVLLCLVCLFDLASSFCISH